MLATIRNRLIVIAVLVVASIAYLIPRTVTVRERGPDGVMHDAKIKRVPLKLGLDLQGGMHIGLDLDQSQKVSANPSGDLDIALGVLRKRIDQFGVTEPVIQRVGDRIVVELAGLKEPERAKAIVTSNAFLEFRLTDKSGAFDNALPSMDRALAQLGVKSLTPDGAAPAKGVEALLGGKDTTNTAAGDTTNAKRDTTKVKGDTAVASASTDTSSKTGSVLQSLITSSSAIGSRVPGEYVVQESAYPRVDSLLHLSQVKRLWPRGVDLKWSQASVAVGAEQVRMLYALEDKAIVTGESLDDATAQIDQLTNRPIVNFELDRAGGRRFGQQTGAHVGDFMAIVLDNYVQGAPPVINSRIDRRGQIELGGRSIADAQDLALTLKAGSLPVPLKIVEEKQVLASLGEDSIHQGVTAGIVGTICVIVIMIGYYRMSGVLAVAALALYLLFTLAGLSAIEATLTLPGLAGIALSVGIAVDANVLIFERIREELIAGRTTRVAVEEGYRHAMAAIIDSNVATVLTALFLFQFGTGPVKGFAVTLILGIAASMITAVFVTKTFFLVWLDRKSDASTLSI